MPVDVESLEDDRRARLLLGESSRKVDGARERRPPGDVPRVGPGAELAPLTNEPKGGMPDGGRAHEPLDVCFRQEVVEPPRLVARHDERAALPMLREEGVGV